jgi:hypothetical protein
MAGLFYQETLVISHDIPESYEFRCLLKDGEFYPQGNDWISDEIMTTFPTYEVKVG